MTTYTQKAYKPTAMAIEAFRIFPPIFTANEKLDVAIEARNACDGRVISYGMKLGYWKKRKFEPIVDLGRRDCYWENDTDSILKLFANASGEEFDAIHAAMLESGERAQNGFTAQITLGTADGRELLEYYPLPKYFTLINHRYAPRFTDRFMIERCDGDGAPSMTGEHIAITANISLDTDVLPEGFFCRLYYEKGKEPTNESRFVDLTGCFDALRAGVTRDTDLVVQYFDRYSDFHFIMEFGDEYERAVTGCAIPSMLKHMNMAPDGSIHITGEVGASLESDVPASFHSGIMNLQAGTVMNTGKVAAGNCADFPVTFQRPFAAGTEPTVVVGFASNSTAAKFGACAVAVIPESVTNTGFTIRFFNGDVSGRNPNFTYIALGTPAI